MDPTTQFYLSFGAQVLFGVLTLYYARRSLRAMQPQDAASQAISVNRQWWPIPILFILSLAVWAPMYFSLRNSLPHLTAHQKSTLLNDAAKMRTMISAIIISSTNGNGDTLALAQDIGDVFNRAGIEPVLGFTRPDNPDQSGIILCIQDMNKPPPETEALKSALEASSIHFKVSGFPKRGFSGISADDPGDRDLVIWVAPNPL